jgi:predicted LPLAT superfamily acyltransferase
MTAKDAAANWKFERERGSVFALRLLRWVALTLGRRVARWLLYPIVAYFVATSRTTRRASREYLARVLPSAPRWQDVFRHVYTFAGISLDRVYLLTQSYPFRVSISGGDELSARVRAGGGLLLFVAHYGSFEAMRVPGAMQEQLPLKVVLDGHVGRQFMAAIAELNPQLAGGIIDSANRGVDHVLAVREALAENALVGMMVDRTRPNDRAVGVSFLGGDARLPAGPWLLAAALRVPVVIAFGTYLDSDRYDVRFEVFAERIDLPRASRDAALAAYVQAYADRLAERARAAPYNWSNFYDFWAS